MESIAREEKVNDEENEGSRRAIMFTALKILHGMNNTSPTKPPSSFAISPGICTSISRSSVACPACSAAGQMIAKSLPTPARSSSRLKCRGSGEIMNHENPPLVLPNGQVYSKKFLQNNYHEKDFPRESKRMKSESAISLLVSFREKEKALPRSEKINRPRRKSSPPDQDRTKSPQHESSVTCIITNQTFGSRDLKQLFVV